MFAGINKYIIGILIVVLLLTITGFVLRISTLDRKIHDLEMINKDCQLELVNMEQNKNKLEYMLNKQNYKLKSIGDSINKNLKDFNIWVDKTQEEKYNNKTKELLSSSGNDLIEKLKSLNYNDL